MSSDGNNVGVGSMRQIFVNVNMVSLSYWQDSELVLALTVCPMLLLCITEVLILGGFCSEKGLECPLSISHRKTVRVV